METVAAAFGAAVFMAVIIERVIEYLVKPPLPEKYHKVIPYVSAGLGVLVAFGIGLDVVSPVLETFGIIPRIDWIGEFFTGLLFGGGANLIHDIWPGKE